MVRWLPWVLFACVRVDTDTDVADTDAAPDTEAEPVHLVPGTYNAQLPVYENDTCNGSFNGWGLAPVVLVWTGDTAFELRYDPQFNVTTLTCAQDDFDVACSGFVQTHSQTPLVETTAVTASFEVTAAWSFDLLWNWTLSCAGDGCEAWAAADGLTFPCTVDVRGRFATEH